MAMAGREALLQQVVQAGVVPNGAEVVEARRLILERLSDGDTHSVVDLVPVLALARGVSTAAAEPVALDGATTPEPTGGRRPSHRVAPVHGSGPRGYG
jgi:hypothetical protein